MKKEPPFKAGFFKPRGSLAFALSAVGLLGVFSFAATPPNGINKHSGSLSSNANALAPVSASQSFTAVGSMSSAHRNHTATLLGNGKVLIAGGAPDDSGTAITNAAEVYDPASGTFMSLSPLTMTSPRYLHTATMLPNGKVLLAGGYSGAVFTNTAELFDPVSATFTAAPHTMNSARYGHTATLLPGGKVLIVGGLSGSGFTNTAELFDPATGVFTPVTSTMSKGHYGHTATLLRSGKVLIAGGYGATGAINTAELFDPVSQSFTPVQNTMGSARYIHTATVLPDGRVLIAGGYTGAAVSNTADIFNPATGTFTQVVMTSARASHTATLLPGGNVLITGGTSGSAYSNTAELFDSSSDTFMATPGTMTSTRVEHTATLLPSGQVLIAGGDSGTGTANAATSTAELFDSSGPAFVPLPNTMTKTRSLHTATLLPSGKVLIAGGGFSAQSRSSAELFDPASGTFMALPNMNSARYFHTATLLPNGKVLLAGGLSQTGVNNTAELFDPASGTFVSVNTMSSERYGHTATLLPNGKVLLTGGSTSSALTDTAELFDPASGTFTPVSSMTTTRYQHTATLLSEGRVLLTGGTTPVFSSPATNTAELFDPATGTFASVSNMNVPRYGHTATLLPSSKVLIAGGATDQPVITNTAELFDPATRSFSLIRATMSSPRFYGVGATLLPAGKVLISGGDKLPISSSEGPTDTADLFDPALETFTPLIMTDAREGQTSTLLLSGKVLITGGVDSTSELATAELFDDGLGFSDARRPVISTAPDLFLEPGSLTLAGAGFRGDSEASGASYNSSATNFPVLQLMRIDNEQTFFVPADATAPWSDTTFSSNTIGGATALPRGQYRATIFTNAIPSIQKIINIGTAVQLASVVSRKTHGSVGTFDIPLTGNRSVECRSGGATGDYTLVFSFANTLTSVGGANVSSGTGSVASSNIDSNDAHNYIVNLTGVANAQTLTVSLSNVTDSTGNSSSTISGSMGVLIGDTNADRSVNSGDISQTKSQSGRFVTGANFREDATADGSINSADVSLVKSKSGTSLP